MEQADEVARLETLHNGKPIIESRHIEIPAAAECFEYYARLGRQGAWARRSRSRATTSIYTLREPLGVVAAIVPWNFPLLHRGRGRSRRRWRCGNTVILKPASQTPLTALALGEIARRGRACRRACSTSSPARGATLGQAIVEHPGIDKIAFTGDTSHRQGHHAAARPTR